MPGGRRRKKSAILTDVGYIYRYIPLDADSEDSEPDIVQLSTYVAPPTSLFQALKRAWNKFFGSPNMSVLHLFHYSCPNLPIGTFKKRLSVLMKPYLPYRHSEPDQLSKVIYDFINIHGISGSRHIHLLKRDDKCAVFTTQRPIQFDGRLLHLSDVDCPTKSPKARHQLLYMNDALIFYNAKSKMLSNTEKPALKLRQTDN